jgi:hypothetical protein
MSPEDKIGTELPDLLRAAVIRAIAFLAEKGIGPSLPQQGGMGRALAL